MRKGGVRAYAKERCETTRDLLVASRAAAPEEIALFWPGGAENPGRDVRAWVFCFSNLSRLAGRAEAREEFMHGTHAGRSAQLLTQQSGAPVVLTLDRPISRDGATIAELKLYPKSWMALRHIAVLARLGTRLLLEVSLIERDPRFVELVYAAQDWRARIEAMLIWAAVHDGPDGKGHGLPWDTTAGWPVLPAWLGDLSPNDVQRVHVSFAEQHGRALAALLPFLQRDGDDDRDPLAGWETFFASYSTEHGLEALQLMQDRAFVPFFTQITLAAHTARQNAKRSDDDQPAPLPLTTVEGR